MLTPNNAAPSHFRQQILIYHTINLHMIGLIHVASRIRNPCGPCRIVGQQQQTFAGFIQSPNRSDPRSLLVEQVIDSRAALFVRCCRHNAPRFVHCQIDRRRFLELGPIHLNSVDVHSHGRLRVPHNSPVQANSIREHERNRSGPRAMAQLRNYPCHTETFWPSHTSMLNGICASRLAVNTATQSRSQSGK